MSKTVMYEYCYDYIKTKYEDKAKLCYTNTDSIIIHIKSEDTYCDLTEDVDKRFNTSNYEVNRPQPIGKN